MKSVILFAALGFVSMLTAGCNSPRLAPGNASINLASAGLPVSMTAPAGATVKKDALEGVVHVEWGDLGSAADLTVRNARIHTLACDAGDTDCKIVETNLRSVLYASKSQTRPIWIALFHFTIGKVEAECEGRGRHLDDARRLLKACESIAVTGPLPPSPVSLTGATIAISPPLALESRVFDVKPVLGKAFKVTARAPKDWTATNQVGTALLRDPAPNAPTALSITFAASGVVKTLADAEREAKQLDAAGLDTIAEKRELSAGKFFVKTAPRGLMKLTTVRVFTRGKRGSAIATCAGPELRRSDLEQICSSVAVD